MEIIVSSFIVMLIMGCVLALTRYGTHYVRESQARLDAQQNVLFSMHKLHGELRESNIKSVRSQDGAVLFADPRDDNKFYRYDDKSRIYWHRFQMVSLEPDGNSTVLVQRTLPLAAPQIIVPLPETVAGATIAAMKAESSLPRTVLGKGLEQLEFTVGTDSIEIRMVGKADSSNSADSYDDFRVEARDKVMLVH